MSAGDSAPVASPRPPRPGGRLLVGCYRGMGDLLYVSSILGQMREELPAAVGIDLAAGAGLWADAVRHLPAVDRVIPVDSWEEIAGLGRGAGYNRALVARVSEWMPFSRYRGWSLRARLQGLHLVDVLARTLRVRLRPENRRPVYHFDPADPEDDPAGAAALGRFAVVAVHGFTHAGHNAAVEAAVLRPLIDFAGRAGRPLVLVGPRGPAVNGGAGALELPPMVHDLRGAPIRRVATFVKRAGLVISVLNGIAVLAEALERPLVLIALGADPLRVVGPVRRPPVAVLGRPGRAGVRSVDLKRLMEVADRELPRG